MSLYPNFIKTISKVLIKLSLLPTKFKGLDTQLKVAIIGSISAILTAIIVTFGNDIKTALFNRETIEIYASERYSGAGQSNSDRLATFDENKVLFALGIKKDSVLTKLFFDIKFSLINQMTKNSS